MKEGGDGKIGGSGTGNDANVVGEAKEGLMMARAVYGPEFSC